MEKLQQQSSDQGEPPPAAALSPAPKILVMDDEQGFRDLISIELQNRGYDVRVAEDGEKGVQEAKKTEFDVVVSDLMMPKISGREALSIIKEQQPKIEFIMITGYATLESAIDAMKRGAYDFITKPFQIDDLLRLVERALEKRRLHEEVDKLQELNRLKSDFLANMSHELRTPMNAIIGYTALLLDESYGKLAEKQRGALSRIQINSKNLLELINNILDLSKLSAGKMTVYNEEFYVGEFVQDVAGTVEPLVREKNLGLHWNIAANLRMKTDKTKLKQIFINLVGNSIKFTKQGKITINAHPLRNGTWVEFEIKDTGIGIAAENIPSLFEEFRQVDASATREYGGTGLGLSITKKLSVLLGGTIDVKSQPGHGSTFTVTMPLKCAPHDENPLSPALGGSSNASSQKILLAIDDDPEILNLLKDSLEGTGYHFMGAQSGEEGLALARRFTPHVITLDIMMPHQDGWSVLQIIKNDPKLNSIPVFIVSILENKALGYALGIADYIVKPVEPGTIREKLKLLDNARPHKILVVDDDESIRELFKETLKEEGYQVKTARNGQGAVKEIRTDKPDILFLDLIMPGASGFDVLEYLEKDPNLHDIRVMVTTAKQLTPQEREDLQKRVEVITQKNSKDTHEILETLKEKLQSINHGKA